MSLTFSTVSAGLVIKVPHATLEQHMVASPAVIGQQLAQQIALYAQQHDLGYYPAFDYFVGLDELDPDLINATQSMTWLVTNLVRSEIEKRLRGVFSRLQFESIQTLAYTMPAVRPGQNNVLLRLAEHFTPDQVKLTLLVTTIRHRDTADNAVNYAKHLIYKWLEEPFEKIEFTHLRYLDTEVAND